ncbi:DMT family transporter [Chengkuizengella axinellae]|uniref:EamA family transporter n=1 Tax=Chengkuizengella axinellae TaxID=3064388 RepID=A0ABT9J304_9BACL|nr:EamA family transporter [Chengkuizengella sp. 2205SS18-9]MDP5275982.1 EamA family transporter [Chengkuizengella sp. 2205SS18-9]
MVILNYLIICFIFGTTFFAIKVGIDAGVDPIFSASLRFIAAGLMVVLFFKIRKVKFPSITVMKQLIIVGFCITFGTFSTLYWAEQYIPSGLAAILSAFGPIMVLLLNKYDEKSKLSSIQVLGLAASLGGVILIAFPGVEGVVNSLWIIASIAVVLSQFFYSFGTIRSKKIMAEKSKISPFLLNGIQMLFGGIMLLIFSIVVEKPTLTALTDTSVSLSLLYLIVFGSIMGHGLFYWLVNKTNPVFPSTWLYVSPIIAMVLGITFLDEAIQTLSIVGSLMVLVGVFLTNQDTLVEYYRKGTLFKVNHRSGGNLR